MLKLQPPFLHKVLIIGHTEAWPGTAKSYAKDVQECSRCCQDAEAMSASMVLQILLQRLLQERGSFYGGCEDVILAFEESRISRVFEPLFG